MKIPVADQLDVAGKKVLLRADVDVGETLEKSDEIKLQTNERTIKFLLEKKSKIIVIGHRGRPKGKKNEYLSLRPIADRLGQLFNLDIEFIQDFDMQKIKESADKLTGLSIIFLENLRFDLREEEDNEDFAKLLSGLADIYINEAFSASAKKHASVVGIPKFLPCAAGFHFASETENLSRVLKNPERPVIIIISGVKKDKLEYTESLERFAEKVLIGGRLPEYLRDAQYENENTKLIVARLNQDKEDITIHSIELFEEEIKKAKTIVLSGPLGKFEEEGQRLGTERVFKAVANSDAFKVAGGGDTQQAIDMFGLKDKFDWVSVGGGAMLEFLASGTLPGIEALIN